MDLDEYQRKAAVSDTFSATDDLFSPAMLEKVLGLTGEAGEVSDKIKKIIRDKQGKMTEEDREAVVKELGDVMWYIAGIARYLEVPLSEVGKKNIEKLQGRMKRGTLAGSGDDR